jgi:hypothetical protein
MNVRARTGSRAGRERAGPRRRMAGMRSAATALRMLIMQPQTFGKRYNITAKDY